ncbi:hypothetical protein [Phreatobacter stygius]|uniref:SH3 domain-containing protein n=1 Tax=Phreatobacter stygius TaxID=1940610 RepID=A0A4D7B4L3_9HYPH|nr:hypothetical protein [Phreatobacter stygius]QCI68749.1 hypothetical protein E8M01_33675 [Phreatobacter stygius]
MKRLVLVLLTSAWLGGGAAAEISTPACSTDGLAWRTDAVFQAALHPALRHQRIDGILCRTVQVFALGHAGTRFTVLRSKVYERSSSSPGGVGAQLRVNLISVLRWDNGAGTVIGRFLVPYDVSRDAPSVAPEIAGDPANPVLTLAPGLAVAYRIEPGAVTPFRADAWVGQAERLVSRGAGIGQVLKVDFTRLEGRLVFFRGDADDPASPGSVSDRGSVLVVRLAWHGETLGLAHDDEARFESRAALTEPAEAAAAASEDAARARLRAGLPDGAEPCDLAGWSNDADPRGMNVRAAPSARARVLGQVPPARPLPAREAFGDQPVKSEFRILGFHDGWFLIDKIQAPGVAYGERYPVSLPRPFAGRGWVSAGLVGAAYANGGLPTGRLYRAPHADAATREALDEAGQPLSLDGSPRHILACSGAWALVETRAGTRGWWRSLCSNQATNCS